MKYRTSYRSSNGQPSNGVTEHTTLADAAAAWASDIGSLVYGSGGDASLELITEDSSVSEKIAWVEHCEGGHISVEGQHFDDIRAAAIRAQEDSEEFGPDQVERELEKLAENNRREFRRGFEEASGHPSSAWDAWSRMLTDHEIHETEDGGWDAGYAEGKRFLEEVE